MASGFPSFQPAQLDVTNLNSAQQQDSVFHATGSPQSGVSAEGNREMTSYRWEPTKRQKVILKQLLKAGEHKPSRARINEITHLLKVHGNVEAENVFHWFLNSHSRNKEKQEKNLMEELSLNQKENAGSSGARIFSSPCNASTAILEPSKRLTEFSLQESANLPKFESSTATKTVFPIGLVENGIVSQSNCSDKKDNGQKNSKLYSLNKKDNAGSPSFSLTNAFKEPAMSMAPFSPAMNMAPFSSQRVTNSLESAPHSEKQTVLPINLSQNQYLQYVVNQHLQSGVNQHLQSGEPVCDLSFRNDMQNKEAVRNDGWLACFTDSIVHNTRGSNVIIDSEVEVYERKHELLELFPLHPDEDLRSVTMQNNETARNSRWPCFVTENPRSPRGSNVIIDSQVEVHERKHELPELFPLRPDGNLRSLSSLQNRK